MGYGWPDGEFSTPQFSLVFDIEGECPDLQLTPATGSDQPQSIAIDVWSRSDRKSLLGNRWAPGRDRSLVGCGELQYHGLKPAKVLPGTVLDDDIGCWSLEMTTRS